MNKLLLLLLLGLLSSCGLKMTSTNFSSPPKNPEELLERIDYTKKTPEFLNLKAKADVTNKNQKTALNISIKSKKDSIIWVSASGLFGIEIIRAQITPDSIYFLNRINQTYFKKPISQINKLIKIGLSFYDVQGIITANPKMLKNNYKLEKTEGGFYLTSDKVDHFIDNNYKIQKTQSNRDFNGLQFSFNNYNSIDGFPRRMNLKIEGEEGLEVAISVSKVEFKQSKNMIFKIPKSYNEIN